MKVAVEDANVLIDMAEADLLGLWFALAIPTHTTDLVLSEVERTGQRAAIQPFVVSRALLIHKTAASEMVRTVSLASEQNVSPEDASALLLAQRLKATLLTGDGRLRKVAADFGVNVRGVLWVFDHLVNGRHLSPKDAARRLRHLMAAGTFLPSADCEARLERWG